jgi:hypothetical protein
MPGLGGFWDIIKIPVHIRKLFIHKFVEQKRREEEAIERERNKK